MTASSATRTDEAQPAKRRIVTAARDLFARQGYAATSIREIAEAAGVAIPTVYWAYGNKRAIAEAIRGAWQADADPEAGLDSVLGIEDAHARLDAFAAFVRKRWERAADVIRIDEEARRAETPGRHRAPRVAAEHGRHVELVLQPLRSSLRRGVSLTDAQDILGALSAFPVFRELTARHWSGKRYERWLSRTARESLLGMDRPWWTATIER